jgi:HNH endonuclease
LSQAVSSSTSYRQVLAKLNLRQAGGNYSQIKKYIQEHKLNTAHFRGKAWNKGLHGVGKPRLTLDEILMSNSYFQSYKLKRRLIKAGLKFENCEQCGWHQQAPEGHIPLELDHINGNRYDNRLENLRILCPNCHSLTPTYRGKAKRKNNAGVAEWYTHNT